MDLTGQHLKYPLRGTPCGIWQPSTYNSVSLVRFGAVMLPPRDASDLSPVPYWRVHWYDMPSQVRVAGDKKWHAVGEGKVFIQAPWSSCIRRIRDEGRHRYLAALTPELSRSQAMRFQKPFLVMDDGPTLDCRSHANTFLSNGVLDAKLRMELLCRVVTCLSKFYENVDDARVIGIDMRDVEAPEQVRQAMAIIESKLSFALPVETIARGVGCSQSHLNRLFQTWVGTSVTKFLIERRIQRAAELLACTDQSIEEIAARCGFSSRHYLTRRFTREIGIPPAEFRKHAG